MSLGITHLLVELVADDLADSQLIRFFSEYSYPFPALYIYYLHRNISAALRVVVDNLKV